jgi:hypothetical protein
VQELRPVEPPVAGAGRNGPRPDWAILSGIAQRLGLPDLSYADAADVRRAIRAELPNFPGDGDRGRRRMTPLPRRRRPADVAVPGCGRFTLVPERAAFRHRGTDLSAVVEGLGELDLESGVRMHPGDLDGLGVGPGGTVGIDLGGDLVVAPARPDPACPRGAVYAVRVAAWGGLAAGDRLDALARLPARPLRVRVTAADGPACARRGDHGRHR